MTALPSVLNKMDSIARSQAKENSTLAKAVDESMQVPPEPKQKIRKNIDKNSQATNTLDQTNRLDISIGSILESEISTPNKLNIETKNAKSIFDKLKTFIYQQTNKYVYEMLSGFFHIFFTKAP